jgi:SAM domain (Sterile alpha motif)
MRGIAEWLASIGLARYSQRFVENAIDGDVLAELKEADLEKLGIPLGDRKRLVKAIRAMVADSPSALTTRALGRMRKVANCAWPLPSAVTSP